MEQKWSGYKVSCCPRRGESKVEHRQIAINRVSVEREALQQLLSSLLALTIVCVLMQIASRLLRVAGASKVLEYRKTYVLKRLESLWAETAAA